MRCPTIAAVLAAFLLSAPVAFGQGAVQQSGVVAPGHLAIWGRNGVIMDGGPPPVLSGPILYATNPSYAGGVKPDSKTPNDAAMKSATDACAAQGATLVLPPGQILLNGHGNVTSNLRNCGVVGAGIPAGSASIGSQGTMILLNSTTTKPFICQGNFSVTGVAFYWPNQTGTTVYPPLFSDDSVNQCKVGVFNNITIVNAYDSFKQTPGGGAVWGDLRFVNSQIFSVHEDFNLNNIGNGIGFIQTQFAPGAWLSICPSCTAAVGAGASVKTVFHITSSGGGVVNIGMGGNSSVVGARYGFLVDNGAILAESQIIAGWDAVGTIIDSSAGGTTSLGLQFDGINAGCETPAMVWGNPNTGNAPCFNLGANGWLELANFKSAGTRGSFIVTAGASVAVENSSNRVLGGNNDGLEYYTLQVTGGTPDIRVMGNAFVGNPFTTNAQRDHVHGISVTAGAPTGMQIENNQFNLFYDDLNFTAPTQTTVVGNTSSNTRATSSITLSGTNGIVYGNNNWDRQPVPILGSDCNGSGAAVIVGFFSGHVALGASGSITACTLTFPFVLANGFSCIPNLNSGIPSWGNPASATAETFSFPSDVHGQTLFYVCRGGRE